MCLEMNEKGFHKHRAGEMVYRELTANNSGFWTCTIRIIIVYGQPMYHRKKFIIYYINILLHPSPSVIIPLRAIIIIYTAIPHH